jgi:hypothetical protein
MKHQIIKSKGYSGDHFPFFLRGRFDIAIVVDADNDILFLL